MRPYEISNRDHVTIETTLPECYTVAQGHSPQEYLIHMKTTMLTEGKNMSERLCLRRGRSAYTGVSI